MDIPTWRSVIKSIEAAIPLYDEINESISLGRASRARTYAAGELLKGSKLQLVLDSGVGPGTMTRAILEQDPNLYVVALDYSITLLRSCIEHLHDHQERVQFVRGHFEGLPFRAHVFDAAVTAFALRDSTDLARTVDEYARSLKPEGQLVVVDLGKPDNPLKRFFALLYVRYIMPAVAKIRIANRLPNNPWVAIMPTYASYPTTGKLLNILRAKFRLTKKKEFLGGGILVMILQPRSQA